MGRWDNPRSVTMLIIGAFLVSLGLFALLSMDRTRPEAKRADESGIGEMSRTLTGLASSWKDREEIRRSLLFASLAQDSMKDIDGMRPSRRRLQYVVEEPMAVVAEHNRTGHPIRHEKHRKLNEKHQLKHNGSLGQKPEETRLVKKENVTERGNADSKSVKWSKWNGTKDAGRNETEDILKQKLGTHQNCYTTNEVLEIIAVTCLVNFIFWFLIISCVNFYTKNQKIWKADSCESLESLGSNIEYEVTTKQTTQDAKANSNPSLRHSASSYTNVQEYVDSLTVESDNENQLMISMQDLSGEKPEEKTARSSEEKGKRKTNRWIDKGKSIHFSSIFNDIISLDNLKPLYEKNLMGREKHKKLKVVSSFSMEDLIF